MEYADEAFGARRRGQFDAALRYFERAFIAEKSAAILLVETDLEPTRSVLCRSAATLALDCGKVREAEKLVAIALAGDPPDEIANELREIFELANFERHLELHDLSLGDGDLQITFAGNSISKGIAPRKEVFTRVGELEKLLLRTDERINAQGFSENLHLQRKIDFYISTPRAASFSMTLKFGLLKQLRLPSFGDERSVIDELMTCLELLNQRKLQQLQEKIPDPAYFRNFVGLAKKIAPDGDRISLVGLTALKNGTEWNVRFSQKREEFPDLPIETAAVPDIELSEREETVSGVLKFADAMKSDNEIRLEVENGKAWKILVREGLMEDIVRPHWGERVRVRGLKVKKKQKTLVLSDILPLEDKQYKLL